MFSALDKKRLGLRLRGVRKEAGIASLEEMSARLRPFALDGASPSNLGNIERGGYAPSSELVHAWAQVCDVTVGDLLDSPKVRRPLAGVATLSAAAQLDDEEDLSDEARLSGVAQSAARRTVNP